MSTVVVLSEAGGELQTNHLHESHQLIETRTLTLKLSSPPPNPFEAQIERTLDSHSCWDFRNLISSDLTSSSSSSYVPPTTNKSLPNVCLELCTENLGSESGSDASDHSNILSLLMSSSSSSSTPPRQPTKQSKSGAFRKMQPTASKSFPPPLTTIRGTNPIRVRPKREGGRLVIEAVEEPSPCSYFRSERSHGHLRLCFWDNISSGSVSDHEDDDEEEENEGNCDDQEIEEELNARVEIGSQKFERSSRCKEGRGSCNSKGELCNWKPFWVAT